uniref:Connector enhancer of kinase suppressor of ras 3 n=1 Tax=Zeugodacus cucurbitae TaxID=28588 RepID=A0A0A1WLL9_ZEUCU
MAYINVVEWTTDQVTDWLKGLDESMEHYIRSFTNNEVGGRQLLNIRPYELEQLGMYSIGHQEIVLEAVENLRNFYYNLDKENLQFMALHVATAAHSLHRQLVTHSDSSKIETQILSDITRTIGTIKPLIGWLERAPFQGQVQFTEICKNLLRLGLEMATMAQRDRFVERPVDQIRVTAEKLERLANYIIQDISDPMLLQPASLNLVTVKKREMDPGFEIESNYHGVHRITEIRYNSPAHTSGKIEYGDEIVQINYQTVVGWQGKTVWHQLHVSPTDVLLTLKKRPKHTKIYGQIYMQPYRLPSKKRTVGSRWGENLPPARTSFLTVPNNQAAFELLKSEEKAATTASDTESNCSDTSSPTETKTSEKRSRLYYEKPRTVLQRRHTISGDLKCSNDAFQHHKPKAGIVCDPSSPSLRDKCKSFGFGLELTSRPKTCIGMGGKNDGANEIQDVFNKSKTNADGVENGENSLERSKPGVSKVVRFDANMKYEDYPVDQKYTCNVENTILETFEPILFADEEDKDVLDMQRNTVQDNKASALSLSTPTTTPTTPKPPAPLPDAAAASQVVEAVNVPIVARRGRLDKSHSTPAYDNTGAECDTPPAIEPRKEFLQQTPPVPPPRPRKQKDMSPQPVPPPPPKPLSLMGTALHSPANITKHNTTTINTEGIINTPLQLPLPTMSQMVNSPTSNISSNTTVPHTPTQVNELHTPTKSRTLSLKKKHSLVNKRRNVNLKVLGTGDIQGHLYRRTKDRRGVTFWARLYFVMLNTILYGFRSKEATKASCVIFLPGFTVSLAKEVHSKPHAFKVYHAAKTFYFAVESQDALNQWVELLKQATLHTQPSNAHNMRQLSSGNAADDINTKDLFSETDSSGEETESLVSSNLCTPSPQSSGKDIITNLAANTSTPNTSQPKQERSYLGSLRKLTKNTLQFKSSTSSSEKKHSSDIPVPTDQYRSYRKVPGGSFGLQIGTNTPGYHHDLSFQLQQSNNHPTYSMNTSQPQMVPLTSAPPPPQPQPQQIPEDSVRKLSLSSSRISIASNGTDFSLNSSVMSTSCLGPPSSPAPVPERNVSYHANHQSPGALSNSTSNSSISSRSMRKIPYNFIHASNPNLVEFDFQTSKTLDYSLPKISSANSWDAPHNIHTTFITLKDLMLRKQEEEAQEMYNNRVLLGVEKKDILQNRACGSVSGGDCKDSCAGSISSKLSKTQNRSLPKTPDYEISFKPTDEDIRRTRTKEGLKLRDFGYELISGDEPISSGGGGGIGILTASRQNSNMSTTSGNADHHSESSSIISSKSRSFALLPHKSKKHSSNSCSSTSSIAELSSAGEKRSGSIKKKSKSERIFQQFHKHSSNNNSGNSAMTMTLPLNKHKNSQRDVELSNVVSGTGIKKSHTYNHDLKEKAGAKYDAHRKNSVPILTKLSTTFGVGGSNSGSHASGSLNSSVLTASGGKGGKEKRLLGSPLLHRTVFGTQHHHRHQQHNMSGISVPTTPTCAGREYDREIFSQIIFPKVNTSHHHHHQHQANHFQGDRMGSINTRHTHLTTSQTNEVITAPEDIAPPPPHESRDGNANGNRSLKELNSTASNAATINSPEYPHMECPPVFEPEIYSLTDPLASQTLLLRRKDSGNKGVDKQ